MDSEKLAEWIAEIIVWETTASSSDAAAAAEAIMGELGLHVDWTDEARGKAGISGIVEVES